MQVPCFLLVAECRAAWYVGIPRAGKTRLAHSHLVQQCKRSRWPGLVVDSQGVDNFQAWPKAASTDEAGASIWGARRSIAYTPPDAECFEAIIRQVLDRGRCNLLIDEAAFWLGAHRGRGGSLLRLLRAYRHAPASVFLTTQHLSGDVPQEALSCAPELFVFRCTSPAVLDRLEREYSADRRQIAALPQGCFVRISQGF